MEETKVQYLIDLGNTILACVQSGGEAERHIDSKLSEVEERWFNLVTQVCMWGGVEVWVCGGKGKNTHVHEEYAHVYSILCIVSLSLQGDGVLDQRESAANKVLINWRAYTDMYRGTQSFVTQMVKMVGTEPLEASGGNTTLLPTYRVCAVTSCTHNVPRSSPLSSIHHRASLPSVLRPSLSPLPPIPCPFLLTSSTILFPLSSPNLFLSIFASSIKLLDNGKSCCY